VVHVLISDARSTVDVPIGSPSRPPRVGFVVSRAVGGSVVRHRVQRRLRHLCRDRLEILPPGSEVVVRALAPSAHASYQELGTDLDRCLERALVNRRSDDRPRPGTVS
jgi:ribonuclease P protein component